MPGSRLAWSCCIAAGLAILSHPHLASQAPPPSQPTFRTSTNLVVIDAVVIDDRGRHVRDLTAADFEVIQSGRTMQVRQAVYVDAAARAALPFARTEAPGASSRQTLTSISDARVEDTARIIALVVDDLGLSFDSTYSVRRALTKFVDEQVRPGDLVAILRTSTGAGALQQFTTDKRLLHAAIERVRWTVFSRSGISAFTPVVGPDALGGSSAAGSGTAEADDDTTVEGLRTSMLAAGSLGALEFVIRGVEPLPGRKSVVFFSEGMRLMERPKGLHTGGSQRVWRTFTRVMDRANRAGVVVYTIDPRGLATGGLTAEDNPHPPASIGGPGGGSLSSAAQNAVLVAAAERRRFLLDSQEGLTYIAEQTGGFAVLNTNDLSAGLDRVLDDLSGYYLIGYEGVPDTVRAWDPGRVRVRVKRPGLRVRSRKGLFGPADSERAPEAAGADPLVAAAMSPFAATTLDVRVTGLFGHEPGKGSYLRSLFFIDPSDVRFTAGEGRQVAQITLVLLLLGDDGRIAAQSRRLIDLDLLPDTYRLARERGILYNARIPVKRAGAYQLRVAARDEGTNLLGSGSQYVEIPKVGKGHLALSSIIMQAADAAVGRAAEAGAGTEVPESLDAGVFGEPWVRIFRPGSDAVYTYEIYDGVTDDASTLTTVAVLMRDGRTLYEGPVSPLRRVTGRRSVRVVPVAGRLSFSRATEPGTYTLRVTVSQVRHGKVRRQQHQWATFEVR